MTEQTVGNGTEAPVTPAAEAPTAQDTGSDLTALLNEFAQGTQPTTQPQTTPTQPAAEAPEVTALKTRLEGLERTVGKADLMKAYAEIRGDADPDLFSNGMVNGWLSEHPKVKQIQQVWENREADPAAAKRLVASLKAEFAKGPLAKMNKRPDPNVTEDVESVTAAVRGARHNPPPDAPPKFGGQSNSEFRKSVREQYGYDPGV